MKNMKGIVDPISLTFALILGIATMGNIAKDNTTDQQTAQDTQIELNESAEAAHQYLASK